MTDFLSDSIGFVVEYEKTYFSGLPNDELAFLKRRPEATRLTTDLV